MTVTSTTTPCRWGVDDVSNPNLPLWERGFEGAAHADYRGPELGPYGYVPLNRNDVKASRSDVKASRNYRTGVGF